MVKTALKWIFFLWLLSLGAGYVEELVATWSAGRPTLAEARISELAEEIGTGELTADDLEAALVEIAELQDAQEANPAPPPTPTRPPPTAFEDMLGRVAEAASSANEANAPPPTIPADVEAAAAAAESAIEELDALYGEWIAVLEAVQETHTDDWEQRWARDRVTIAKGARVRGIRDLRLGMEWRTMTGTLLAERRKLEGTARSAGNQQNMIRRSIVLAEQALEAIPAPAPDAGSQGPTDLPGGDGR